MQMTVKRRLGLAFAVVVFCASAADPQNTAQPQSAVIPQCHPYRLITEEDLSAKQRACLWQGNLLTPSAVFGAGFSSAYGLLTKEEPAWGQGAQGYARLYAARYAQGLTKATGQYLTAWALHEDPRRQPANCVAWKRALCAARNMFAQPKESGGYRPVLSTLAGAAAGGFIGMSFYPNTATVTGSLSRTGTSLATSLLSVELTEFRPDIRRLAGRLFVRKNTAKEAFTPATENP